jgi:hypothetical protein
VGSRITPALGNCLGPGPRALLSGPAQSIPREMDRHPEPNAEAAGPPIRMLVLAACMPFCVVGLLALPIAFNTLKVLVGG